MTLFHLEKDSGHARPLPGRRAIDRNPESEKDCVFMKGSDLLPALLRPHRRKSDQTKGGFGVAAFIPLTCVHGTKGVYQDKVTFARIF